MIPDLLVEQYQEEDLVSQFDDYSILDLQSNLLKLIQTNIVYAYCETVIVEDLNCDEEYIARIIKSCKAKDRVLLNSILPFHILQKLKSVKDEIKGKEYDRYYIINLILNLIVENTLLHSTLAKFAYN